eukprot:scaffold9776_cov117-Cylindrotheca_fusiformis.AAC.2
MSVDLRSFLLRFQHRLISSLDLRDMQYRLRLSKLLIQIVNVGGSNTSIVYLQDNHHALFSKVCIMLFFDGNAFGELELLVAKHKLKNGLERQGNGGSISFENKK